MDTEPLRLQHVELRHASNTTSDAHAKLVDEQVDSLHAVTCARPSHIPHHGALLSMRESSVCVL
jgi:hypothetical protein